MNAGEPTITDTCLRVRRSVATVVERLSQTQEMAHAVKRAGETLQDDEVLLATITQYRTVIEQQSKLPAKHSLVGEDLIPYENSQLKDRLNVCRVILLGFAQRRSLIFHGCINGAPFQPGECTHGCADTLTVRGAAFECVAMDHMGMCEADLSAVCAVLLDIPDGVIPVFSEKIKMTEGKVIVVADDNSCYESHPGRGLHYVDISRFAKRTTFAASNFNTAVEQAGKRSIKLLALAYSKLLADFQSIFGLDGPLGGSFICSYFKARQGTWGSVYVIVRALCEEEREGCIGVQDEDGHRLTITLARGQATVVHDHVGLSIAGKLAAAVVEAWTAGETSSTLSCLNDRTLIAAALSKLKWNEIDDDFDAMSFTTSAVAVHEQGDAAKLALRDLKLYENLVRWSSSATSEHQQLRISDEAVSNQLELCSEQHNEWSTLADLLQKGDEDNQDEDVDFFNLSDWARDIPIVPIDKPAVDELQILPGDGWFPAEGTKKRFQCSFKRSIGSLFIANKRLCFSSVPKLLVGTVHFMRRVTRVSIMKSAEIELAEYNANERGPSDGALNLAISGLLGKKAALWALAAIYTGKITISPNSTSSIKNCAGHLDENGYLLEAVMPTRVFNQVAVATDGTSVYAMLGTGLRCAKVVKRNAKMSVLERVTLQDISGLERGVLTGGQIVG